MPSPVPVDFGKYQLLERLAVGGMAELYRARFQALAGVSKPVVIKKILPAFADSEAFVSMFVNEARIAVSLSHGNIAQVFDFGEIDGEYFLAMEYVHGQPLSRVLRRAHALQFPFLPEAIALQIAMGMCRGLHYAHSRVDDSGRSRHIVHRDVSPQNVLLGYGGEVKIVDFGIARARNATGAAMQATGVKGKFPYFSPEQARGEPVDYRTDLYATGVVLYQMLCGRLPHLGKMVPAMQSIVRGEFPPPRGLNPRLSPELEATVLRAMAYAPGERFASAQDLEHALADALHALGVRPPTVGDFMSFLFEPELFAEGQEVKLPRALLEAVPEWRKGTRPEAPPEAVPSVTTAAVPTEAPPAPTRPWKLLALVGAALLLGTVLAAVLGRVPTFELELLSEPSGASVEVDGSPVAGTTPLRITHLGADQPHQLRVRLPGRPEWTGEISGRSGTTVHLRAELPAVPQVGLDSPHGR
ncbi:MAG TPA: serine/threonine-protein kinase [Myxococcaceae bacterium]|nr:serine/threonine-protein kinase [Myxococcaceae bacterium]